MALRVTSDICKSKCTEKEMEEKKSAFPRITKENKRVQKREFARRSVARLPEIRPDNGIIYGSFN